MISIEKTSQLRNAVQASFDKLVDELQEVQIGTVAQFPMGWGKAAKGRMSC